MNRIFTKSIIYVLCMLVMFTFVACTIDVKWDVNNDVKKDAKKDVKVEEIKEEEVKEENKEEDVKDKEKDIDFESLGIEDIKNDTLDIDSGDSLINDAIKEKVILTSDEEFEDANWVDDEHTLFRVAIQRKEELEDYYLHKKDYFFAVENRKAISFMVDYPSTSWKDKDSDRYVYSACDFNADIIDVNFDGYKDLVIFLGNQGSHGVSHYCAYIYKDGDYVYTPSFEDIPNYKLNEDKKVIEGWCPEDASSHVDFIFEWNGSEFVEISKTVSENQ
ncbi:MAG: hypothetical protein K5769_03225 [Pseudobutyrivibrio sp.]|nr:hypothetical protein [Pseudobutyrivibrio sp.]